MTTALEKLMETKEGREALCVEKTILNVTELLCTRLEQSGMSRTELAARIGVTPGRITQLLDGNANLTLASIAKALAAFEHVLEVSSTPIQRHTGSWEQFQSLMQPSRVTIHCRDGGVNARDKPRRTACGGSLSSFARLGHTPKRFHPNLSGLRPSNFDFSCSAAGLSP